ncbi:hypothetical protein [Microbacterium schleiferi]|uniref:hypothetical protein n=1 Tax=Microbacterium schleiferi TaxID=69362 RepID=UPI001E2D1968|nr:hypothetical protein [Microbacterium schleiferi]
MLGVPFVIVFTGIAWPLSTRVLFRFTLDEVPCGKQPFDEEIAKFVARYPRMQQALRLSSAPPHRLAGWLPARRSTRSP